MKNKQKIIYIILTIIGVLLLWVGMILPIYYSLSFRFLYYSIAALGLVLGTFAASKLFE